MALSAPTPRPSARRSGARPESRNRRTANRRRQSRPRPPRPDHRQFQRGRNVMTRICDAVLAAAVVALLLPSTASSQTWPNRPVTIMMPQPAGGIADLLARGTAQALSDEFGQPFIVDNRVGASGNLAAAAVAKSAPDGSTFLYATQAQVVFNKLMFATMPY